MIHARLRARARIARRCAAAIAALGLLLLAPVLARAQVAGADSVALAWTAPGDDGNIGTAAAYELRFSLSAIDATSWDAATVIPGAPVPSVAGTRQSLTVRGLTRGTPYWFAIKARDDAGNWSAISNVLPFNWPLDTSPPPAPTGVTAAVQGSGVRVAWSASSAGDLAGYRVYRATGASGPWTSVSGVGSITATVFVDNSLPPGAPALWYAVTALDQSDNESARSAAVQVVLSPAQPGSSLPTAWAVETGYPNPSRAGSSVTIPVSVPASGAASARLEIVDGGGRTIRHLDLGALAPGARTVTWDGKNDGGREVAPGPYSAWLIAGDTRQHTGLVRIP